MTTTRELANRLRSALGWIDSHADSIPGGWGFTSWPNTARPSMSWLRGDAATVEALTHLLGDPEVDGDGEIFTWRAEGDRPELSVYTDEVQTPSAEVGATTDDAEVEGPGEAGQATPAPPARPVGKCGAPDPGQREGNWSCRLPVGHDGDHSCWIGSLGRRWSA